LFGRSDLMVSQSIFEMTSIQKWGAAIGCGAASPFAA
jgi:hypothetical protein